MSRLLDMLRLEGDDHLGQTLVRLAKAAVSQHRLEDAASEAAERPLRYQKAAPLNGEQLLSEQVGGESIQEQCRIEGFDPRTVSDDAHASGTSPAVTDDGGSTRSNFGSTSSHKEVA